MDSIRTYLLGVIATAVICSLVQKLMTQKCAYSIIIKLMSGLVLAFAVVAPLTDLTTPGMNGLSDAYVYEASMAVEEGKQSTKEAMSKVILEQTKSYILDKAAEMNVNLHVQIKLSDDEIPRPLSITLSGSIAPYAKNQMQTIIERDLGIRKENQKWN